MKILQAVLFFAPETGHAFSCPVEKGINKKHYIKTKDPSSMVARQENFYKKYLDTKKILSK